MYAPLQIPLKPLDPSAALLAGFLELDVKLGQGVIVPKVLGGFFVCRFAQAAQPVFLGIGESLRRKAIEPLGVFRRVVVIEIELAMEIVSFSEFFGEMLRGAERGFPGSRQQCGDILIAEEEVLSE